MIKLKDCAIYYEGLTHQNDAWEYLQQNTTDEILETFASCYRGTKVEAGVQETEPTRTSQAGIDLIKSFEGLELSSYYCSSNVLTIGYGHTQSVEEGQTITEHDAEELLRKDLMWFEQEVSRLIVPVLTQHEFDAIVSFTFNTGSGALASSTFCKRMNDGENKARCFREEFPKWVKGPNGPLPGLVRRRDAEVELATS